MTIPRRLLLLLLWLLALVLPGSAHASLPHGGVTLSPPLLALCSHLDQDDDSGPLTLHLDGLHDRAGPRYGFLVRQNPWSRFDPEGLFWEEAKGYVAGTIQGWAEANGAPVNQALRANKWERAGVTTGHLAGIAQGAGEMAGGGGTMLTGGALATAGGVVEVGSVGAATPVAVPAVVAGGAMVTGGAALAAHGSLVGTRGASLLADDMKGDAQTAGNGSGGSGPENGDKKVKDASGKEVDKVEHAENFDKAREKAFEQSGMTNPDDVKFSKEDPKTGTVTEFKGTGDSKGAKVSYDSPHADMDASKGHDQPHVGWQAPGKRPSAGGRGNITYDGEQHPSRPADKN